MTASTPIIAQSIDLLLAEEEEDQEYGMELVQQLLPEQRWAVACGLTAAAHGRWRLAARCVLPEPLIEHRLRRFTARWVLRLLYRERAAGREPSEGAWEAVEMCERLGTVRGVRGVREKRRLKKMRDTIQPYLEEWYDDDWYGMDVVLGEQDIDLEAVEDSERSSWHGLGGIDLYEVRRGSEDDRLAIFLRTVERMEEVNHAAIRSVVEHIPDEWEEDQDYLPTAQTVRDWRWLRRAWRRVVIEGQDGLDLVWQ